MFQEENLFYLNKRTVLRLLKEHTTAKVQTNFKLNGHINHASFFSFVYSKRSPKLIATLGIFKVSFKRNAVKTICAGQVNFKKPRPIPSLKVFRQDRFRSIASAIIVGTMFLTVVSEVEAQGAGVASSAAAAVTAVNAYYQLQRSGRDFSLRKVNQSTKIDLSNKRICVVPRDAFREIKKCREGDVVVFSPSRLQNIIEVCKMDEPIYVVGNEAACVYENHEKKVYRMSNKERTLF